MNREEQYIEKLKDLNIYDDAFFPLVHMLTVLEREQSRLREEWKIATNPGHYRKITRRIAKEAEKLADSSDISGTAEAWKETAEAWRTAEAAWQAAAEKWSGNPLINQIYSVMQQQDKLILSIRESLCIIGRSEEERKKVK